MPDGLQNNLNGIDLESDVVWICSKYGLDAKPRQMLDPSIGLAPHGTRTKLSAWVFPCSLFPHGLGIDASSYEVSGTAYQKVPFKIMNAGGWKCLGLVILEGDGRGIGPMRRYAIEMAKEYPNCVGVFRLNEFEDWLAKTKQKGEPILVQGNSADEFQMSLLE